MGINRNVQKVTVYQQNPLSVNKSVFIIGPHNILKGRTSRVKILDYSIILYVITSYHFTYPLWDFDLQYRSRVLLYI